MVNKREHHHVFLIPRNNTSERLADPATMVGVAKGPGCRRTEREGTMLLGMLVPSMLGEREGQGGERCLEWKL